MIFSFLQGLSAFGDDYQDTRQLLDTVLDTDIPALEYPDKISVQYWIYRTKKRLDHKAARAWTQWVPLCMFQSSKSFLDGISTAVLSAKPDLISRIPPQKYHALWYNFWTFISGVVLYARYD